MREPVCPGKRTFERCEGTSGLLESLRVILGEDGFDDGTSDVGEAEAAAVVGVGELLVIEAELVEDGGVDVVDVGFVDGGVVADFVGFAVAHAAFDAASGHPGGEAMRVVVTAGFGGFLGKR